MSYFNPVTDPLLYGCPCGTCTVRPDPTLIEMLEKAREVLHEPIVVTSGPRCQTRNRMVGGADDSRHVNGTAADLRAAAPSYRRRLALALDKAGFRRIFFYADHLHVDLGADYGWWVSGL